MTLIIKKEIRRGRSPFKPYSVRPHGPGLCEYLIKQNKGESRYSTSDLSRIQSVVYLGESLGVWPRWIDTSLSPRDKKSEDFSRSIVISETWTSPSKSFFFRGSPRSKKLTVSAVMTAVMIDSPRQTSALRSGVVGGGGWAVAGEGLLWY
ncbi:hypothetical protein J6590_011710 [Homalodisca vitripennis]|nr:hypothetical protein J6590_011710 [Homalodisca vitripennis]